MQNDEEFNGRVQHVRQGLQNLVAQVNLTRQMLRNRVQLTRELVTKPVVKTWQESRPRPLSLGVLEKTPPQPEREAKQPEPILQTLVEMLNQKPKPKVEPPVKAPQVEVEPKPAPRWEKPALL